MTRPLLNLFDDLAISSLSATDLRQGALRLDASFYGIDNLSAQRALTDSGLKIDRLSEVAQVFCSNIRGRTFVSPGTGVALLGGHNLDTDDDRDIKYVSRVLTRGIERERLLDGDTLISSAGTIGFFDFVWGNHAGKLASQHIIRLRPIAGKVAPGYLYAYISSPLALSMVTSQSAGSVIETLYTEHLEGFPLPRLTPGREQRIHEKIVESFEKRRKYREHSRAAQQWLMEVNNLSALPSDNEENPDCIAVPYSSQLMQGTELRLEAHFYNPIAQVAIENLDKSPSPKRTVGEVTTNVFFCNRFTRTFVTEKHGIPYLAGKNIVEIRPRIEDYLSVSQTEELDEYRLRRGWSLITCSGTVGRVCFVWKNFEKYVATHDLIRVIADDEKIDAAYLYAFLASPYGYEQILRFRHGSVIDHVTPEQINKVIVPLPAPDEQKRIGDRIRMAYESRAEALSLEDEAQEILIGEITAGKTRNKGRNYV